MLITIFFSPFRTSGRKACVTWCTEVTFMLKSSLSLFLYHVRSTLHLLSLALLTYMLSRFPSVQSATPALLTR